MEAVLALLVLCVALPVLAFPFWVLARLARISQLESDVRRLEARVDTLADTLAASRVQTPVSTHPSAPVETSGPVAPQPVRTVVDEQTGHLTADTQASAAEPVPQYEGPAPTEPRVVPTPVPPVRVSPSATPALAGPAQSTATAHPIDASLELEEKLGANWLNKLGALLLVLGIGFFLTYQLRTLGALGKDTVGLGVGAVLLAGGVIAERRTAYVVFSRGVMAAGWAVLFFTVFAMYHVPAARVIDSEVLDLVLMLAVAGGMVAHAVLYRSQIVTALAFLFAFATVAISHDAAFTLTATAILALASAMIVVRLQWYALEVGAIAGTYLNQYLAVRMTGAGGAHALSTSLALLVAYWVTFRLSYVVRQNVDAAQERWSTLAAVANTGGALVVATRFGINQDLVFWALVTLAAADAAFAKVIAARRLAFVTLTTLCAAMLAAAFPFRFGTRAVSLAWFIEAEALVAIGIRTRDGLFTRLGVAASVLAGAHVFTTDVQRLVVARSSTGVHPSAPDVALILATAAAVYYVNSLHVRRAFPQAFSIGAERVVADKLSYAGAAALLSAGWALVPGAWLPLVFLGTALLLAVVARSRLSHDVWFQSQAAAFLAIIVLAASGFESAAFLGPLHRRIVIVGLAAAGHHALFSLSRLRTLDGSRVYGVVHSWIGSALVVALAWYELDAMQVVLAWAAFSVLLLEAGIASKRSDLRAQALLLLGMVFVRLWLVNLRGTRGVLGTAALTTMPLAFVFFYAYERTAADREALKISWLPEVLAAMATTTIAAVLEVALDAVLVAPAWSALVLVAAIWSRASARRTFGYHSAAGAGLVALRAIATNLSPTVGARPEWWADAWFTVGVCIALLVAAIPVARGRRADRAQSAGALRALASRPDQVFFFCALILAIWLAAVRTSGGFITMAWGIEAVLAFLLALSVRERTFRLAAVALLLACVLRIALVDVWQLDQQGRYVAFIALGSALLLVSFLYSKYRGLIEEYLLEGTDGRREK